MGGGVSERRGYLDAGLKPDEGGECSGRVGMDGQLLPGAPSGRHQGCHLCICRRTSRQELTRNKSHHHLPEASEAARHVVHAQKCSPASRGPAAGRCGGSCCWASASVPDITRRPRRSRAPARGGEQAAGRGQQHAGRRPAGSCWIGGDPVTSLVTMGQLFSEGWDRARRHHQQLDRGMTIARE